MSSILGWPVITHHKHKDKALLLLLHQSTSSFLSRPSLDACWELRPAPLSTQSQVHSGSFLLALYQRRLHKWKLGLCVFAEHGDGSYFLGAWLSRADYVFVHADICEYVCLFALARLCEQRDQIPSLSPGTQQVCHFKGARGARSARLPTKGEILFMWRGLIWQDRWLTPQPGAHRDCHHPCRFKS